MRRSLVSLALAACGPATTVHPETVQAGCPDEVRLSGPEDVAALAGCSKVGTLAIRTGAKLDLAPLRRLRTIERDLVVGPSVGFEELALPELAAIGGALRVVGNGNLRGVFLPKLTRVEAIDIDGNVALVTVSLPRLARAGTVRITQSGDLEMIELSSLAAVDGELAIANNPKLVLIEAGKLERAGKLRVEDNPSLPEAQIPALPAPRDPR